MAPLLCGPGLAQAGIFATVGGQRDGEDMQNKGVRGWVAIAMVIGCVGIGGPVAAQERTQLEELSAYFVDAATDSLGVGEERLGQMRDEVIPQVASVFAERIITVYPEMVEMFLSNASRGLGAASARRDAFLMSLFDPDVLRDISKSIGPDLVADFGEDVLTSIVQAVLIDVTADAFGEIYGAQAGEYFRIVGEGSLEIIEATLLRGGAPGLIVYNAELWYGNARDFAALGRELQRMEDAGVDFASVLIETELWRQTYVQSLATGIYSGPMAEEHAGLVLTPHWRAVMEDILAQMPENIRTLEEANIQLNRVAAMAKGWATFLDAIGATAAEVMAVFPDTTPLDAADGSGAFPEDLDVVIAAPDGFLGFGPGDMPAPSQAWQDGRPGDVVRVGPQHLDVPVFAVEQPGDWGPGVVVPEGIEVPHGACLRGEIDACLRGHGLEGEALAFTLGTPEGAGGVYASAFHELGAVDLVTAHVTYAPYEREYLVNGGLDVMLPSVGYDLGRFYPDDTSQAMLRRFPQASPIYVSVAGHRLLPDGTQRFVIAQTVFDQCRACPILGSGFAFADIGPATGGELRYRAVGVFLEGPEEGSSLSVASLRSNPAYIQVRLNALGYDAGEMDGYPGPQTRRALMAFQTEQCLPETGQPDAATLTALVEADRLRAPCAGAVIEGGRDAFSPLAGGVYMSDPAFCDASDIPYEQIFAVQRIVSPGSFMAGWEDPCQTRRTDIRQEMTRFRGTCYVGPEAVEAEWMLDIQSPERFRVVTSPWGYQPGQVFSQCARDSVQGQNWRGAYAPLPMGLPIPEGMYAVSAQTCNLTDIDLGDRWGEGFTALENGRFVIGYEVTCDVRDVTRSGARLTFDLACNAEGELYDRVEVVDVTGDAQMEWRGQSYVHCPGR